jgi:hypothetical protein
MKTKEEQDKFLNDSKEKFNESLKEFDKKKRLCSKLIKLIKKERNSTNYHLQ